MGAVLIMCGFLSPTPHPCDPKTHKSKASSYTWASIVVGIIMLVAGFTALVRMGKKAALAMPQSTANNAGVADADAILQ